MIARVLAPFARSRRVTSRRCWVYAPVIVLRVATRVPLTQTSASPTTPLVMSSACPGSCVT